MSERSRRLVPLEELWGLYVVDLPKQRAVSAAQQGHAADAPQRRAADGQRRWADHG
jgi:hypothetical protein